MEIIGKTTNVCHNCGGSHYIQNCKSPRRCKFGNVCEKQMACTFWHPRNKIFINM